MRLIFLLVLLIAAPFSRGQSFGQSSQPTVTVAVAPIFILWVFNQTGVGHSIVEVKIDPDGRVTAAKCIEGSDDFPWRDHTFEQTAMRWRFSPATGAQQRTARITFVLRIMPKGTSEPELTPIYSAPYQMEVRHTVYEPQVISEPLPIDTQPKKRP